MNVFKMTYFCVELGVKQARINSTISGLRKWKFCLVGISHRLAAL